MIPHILGGNSVFLLLNAVITGVTVVILTIISSENLWLYKDELRNPIWYESRLAIDHNNRLALTAIIISIVGVPGFIAWIITELIYRRM